VRIPSAQPEVVRTSSCVPRWRRDAFGGTRVCCVAILIVATITTTDARAGSDVPQGMPLSAPNAGTVERQNCRDCHYCDNPTPERSCLLNPCARNGAPEVAALWSEYEGPNVVILDDLEDAYLPVPFDHKGHAQMAAMTTGCTACHHYSPEGQQHPECKTCHDAESAGTDINKPGLKGAYHQMCLSCHREWIDETDCAICHMSKAGNRAARVAPAPTKDDILGQMHPPIPEPVGDIYRGTSMVSTGTRVVFRHAKHVNDFALDCVNCHRESSCASCHRETAEPQRPRTVIEHHQPCILCHRRYMDLVAREAGKCERCHWRSGEPLPATFDHASTGWVLRAYHERLVCRACHSEVPFVRQSKECGACHDAWDPETFDHRVTGQILNETHADIDCDVCHAELRFDHPPACDECHDEEDDGIAFPGRRPGPEVDTGTRMSEMSPTPSPGKSHHSATPLTDSVDDGYE